MSIPEKFKSWFEELCKELQVPDVTLACEQSGLAIEGIPIFFAEGGIGSEEQLLIHAILHTLPKHGAAEMMRRMLELQVLVSGPGCPVFGLDSNTNSILLVAPMDPKQVSPKGAVTFLQALAQAGGTWRELLKQDGPLKVNDHQKKLIKTLKK